MTDDIDIEIEEIIGKMKCPNNFRCYKSGFKELCRARDIGIENYLECLENDPQDCQFSIVYGIYYFCKCPLRYYLAQNSKRDK